MRTLTREEARRIAVRGQMLDAHRPNDVLEMTERLLLLQLDPTAAIAPNADLVSWSRIGGGYQPAQLKRALEVDRTLFEHRAQDSETEPALALVRPMANIGLYLADMATWPHRHNGPLDWLDANEAFRQRVLDQLREAGPLTSGQIPDTAVVPWKSTGWTNNRNATQLLEFLSSRGEIAVAGRRGKHRLWDLAERVYPADVEVVPAAQARRIRDAKRLRNLGVARSKYVGEAGIPVEIEGTLGPWRLDPDASAEGFEGRTVLLSPFDRLIHDRVRALDLFDFDYTLEMYKPKDKRRWGYFALPILHDDRLVGKADALADHKSSALHVHAVHEDVTFTRAMKKAVDAEFAALAAWLGLQEIRRA